MSLAARSTPRIFRHSPSLWYRVLFLASLSLACFLALLFPEFAVHWTLRVAFLELAFASLLLLLGADSRLQEQRQASLERQKAASAPAPVPPPQPDASAGKGDGEPSPYAPEPSPLYPLAVFPPGTSPGTSPGDSKPGSEPDSDGSSPAESPSTSPSDTKESASYFLPDPGRQDDRLHLFFAFAIVAVAALIALTSSCLKLLKLKEIASAPPALSTNTEDRLCQCLHKQFGESPIKPPQPPPDSGVIQFNPAFETALIDFLKRQPTAATPPPPTGPMVLQLSPGLEGGLRRFLEHPPSANPVPWGTIIVALGALAALVLVLRKAAEKDRKAVPAIVGAALAEELVRHSEQFAHMQDWMYWFILKIFAVTLGLALVALAFRFIRSTPDEKPRPGADSAFAYAFSILILLWAIVMVGYRAEGAAQHEKAKATATNPNPPLPPRSSAPVLSVRQLTPAPLFQKKTAVETPNKLSMLLVQNAAESARPGDILFLLGSTDCLRTAATNNALAKQRSQAVLDTLKDSPGLKGVQLAVDALPQPEGCKEDPKLRTVYPFLIRASAPASPNSPPPNP